MSKKELIKAIQLINLFRDFNTWTKQKRDIINLVIKCFESGRHEYFSSDCRIHTAYVGEYYILEADHKRSGTLLKFRGSKVIVLCIGHGSYNVRQYIVAVVE